MNNNMAQENQEYQARKREMPSLGIGMVGDPAPCSFCQKCGRPLDQKWNPWFDGTSAFFCNAKCERQALRASRRKNPIKYGLTAGERYVPHFNGPEYDPKQDHARLSGQIARIHALMKDGVWRNLSEIAARTGDHEASISAQLRNMRKERFGSYIVNKRPRGDRSTGLFEYQLLVPVKTAQKEFVFLKPSPTSTRIYGWEIGR